MIHRMRNLLRYCRWVWFAPLVAVALVVPVGGDVYAATYTIPDPPADTYRVGSYTCARIASKVPDRDPCVYDPDPVGDPVAVEPDNDPVERRFLPDGTDVRVFAGVVGDGDDRGDSGEDGPGFTDCRTQGNGVCGPGNSHGHQAGCYVRSGKRAGVLIRPWDTAMAADQHYRPDGCGVRTRKDREMDQAMASGSLCAANDAGGVTCWPVIQPRPRSATGPAWAAP